MKRSNSPKSTRPQMLRPSSMVSSMLFTKGRTGQKPSVSAGLFRTLGTLLQNNHESLAGEGGDVIGFCHLNGSSARRSPAHRRAVSQHPPQVPLSIPGPRHDKRIFHVHHRDIFRVVLWYYEKI